MTEGLRPEFYKNKWLWLIASILFLFVLFFILKKTLTHISVKTEPIRRQTLVTTVTATSTGTIKSDAEAKIVAQRAGKITRLFFDEGDRVKSNEVVAELDKDETYYNLKMAEATLQKSEFILGQMKASYDSFNVEVEKNIDKAQAVFSEAESRRKRYRELGEKGYATEMDVEAVLKEYEIAKANLNSVLASKGLVKAKSEEIKAQEQARKESMSNLSIARLNHEYSFIRSPISGVITSRPVKLGEGVTKGTLIAAVVSTESMYVEGFIDEADVAKVRLGQRVNTTMDAYPGKVFTGEVYRISPIVLGGKQETRTFEVRVKIKEGNAVIKPGMSADIEIIVDSIPDLLIVPSQAVIEKSGKKFVYAVSGSTARLVPVETGRFNWSFTEIKSGMKEGDEVIINTDISGLRDGVRVRKAQ